MEEHDDMYFTIWYGVYNPSDRLLRYASAGQPPALLVPPAANGASPVPFELRGRGPVLGAVPGTVYREETCAVPENSHLFLMSDGTYEVARPDGTLWSYRELRDLLAAAAAQGRNAMDELLRHVRSLRGGGPPEDDFSLLRLRFG
jgi:sigma-B regulation protein RsbU (phosphoserine phosphatase)